MFTVFLFICAFAASVLSVLIFRAVSVKAGFFDYPKNDLKDHAKPTPYVGTAIFFSFMLVMLGVRFLSHFETGTLHQLRGIIFGGALIFIVGLLDDKFDLDFRVKFFWQIAATALLIHYDIYIKLFPSRIMNIVLSMFWVILVVNAINIIDILDGLAVGISAIAAIAFFMITLPTKMLYVNFASIIICGVLAGFWLFNKPPAKVFMGDAGSLFAGFVLAALSMGADYSKVNIIGLFAPLLILGIPLFDTILVSCLRMKNRQSIFRGSKDHYALRLSVAGFSAWQIDLISYSISFFLALCAFLMSVLTTAYAFFILVMVFILAMVGSSMLSSIDISEK